MDMYLEIGRQKASFILKFLFSALLLVSSPLSLSAQTQTIPQSVWGNIVKERIDNALWQGNGYLNEEQFQVALSMFETALRESKSNGYLLGQARALDYLGKYYYLFEQYSQAIEFYQEALTLFEKLENRDGKVSAFLGLGNAHYSLGEYAKAIEFYQLVSSLYKGTNNRNEQAKVLVNLGNAYFAFGQNATAIELYQQALAIFKDIKAQDEQIKVLISLGNVHDAVEQYAEAVDFYQESLTLSKALLSVIGREHFEHCGYSRSLSELSEIETKWRQQGFSFINQICNNSWRKTMLLSLGYAYFFIEKYEQAIELYNHTQSWSVSVNTSLKIKSGDIRGAIGLGKAYLALGQYDEAMRIYKRLLEFSREIGNRPAEGNALSNSGFALLKTNNFEAAEESLFSAVSIWESLRPGLTDDNKVSLFETQAATYRFLQQALIAQKKIEPALEVAERGKARAFVELLVKRLSGQSSSSKDRTPIKPLSIQQVKQIARVQNATLVQYSIVSDESLYIWVVKPTSEIAFRQVDLKSLKQELGTTVSSSSTTVQRSLGKFTAEITALVNNTRRSLAVVPANPQETGSPAFQPDFNRTKSQLQKLHQLLIDPIADLLPTDPNQHVIFIPQGALFLVPFPALLDTNDKYLIEKHTILTAPSIQVLDLTRQQKSRVAESRGALIVGNPIMPKGLAPLPAAEAEAKAIASLFNTQPILGAQATKAAIVQKMFRARVIHLATHGFLDDVRGLGSSIALAPSGKDDGLLTAEEILDMKLNADLVVLSACDTGRGRITGDGVVGLSRSLIAAGTPSVVVSLWAVNDDSTALLMTEFYQNLKKNPNKAQALRQAMLTMIKSNRNPTDWAAFTLIGEAQ